MYQNGAILAIFLLAYSAIAGRIERSWISGPIVFTAAGLILGPGGLGVLRLNVSAEDLRLLAEATLAMVLFTDAAHANLAVVRSNVHLPERLLLIGLPMTVVLGLGVAWVIFPELELLELALLASMLAPTDAALGKPVVANPALPAAIRESLNVESGLNDGICVPLLVILLSLAVGTQIEHAGSSHMAIVLAEAIGIGLAAGIVVTLGAEWLRRGAAARGWIGEPWNEVWTPALAAACFTVAQTLGGSGFIACFVGGLVMGVSSRHRTHVPLRGAEATGEALALLTWLLFGSIITAVLRYATPAVVLYAVLSLTFIRMLPVFLCLLGTRLGLTQSLFIGWFGPRGLASIVFAVMVYDADLPGNRILMATVACTVLLSVAAHGISAYPLAGVLATRLARTADRPPPP